MRNIITIPKQFTKQGELVVIPRKDYEEFLNLQRSIKTFKTFRATRDQKRDLRNARKDFAQGKYITFKELKDGLGGTYSS